MATKTTDAPVAFSTTYASLATATPSTNTNAGSLIPEPATTIPSVVVSLLALASIVTLLLWRHGQQKTCPWYVQFTAWVGWTMPFLVIFLLPSDMTSSLFRECLNDQRTGCDTPFSYVSRQFLLSFWGVVYWTAQILTWVIIPIMRTYLWSGEFGFANKLKDSLRYNAIYHGALAGVGVVAYIVYGASSGTWDPRSTLLPFAMSMANAYGLLLIVVFLGSGLIEFPRDLWYSAYHKRSLRFLQLRAPKVKEAFMDEDAELHHIARLISYVNEKVTDANELRPFVNRIIKKCPLNIANLRYIKGQDKVPETITMSFLVALHEKLKRATVARGRMYAKWRILLRQAWKIQDIISNRDNKDRRMHSTLQPVTGRKFHDERLMIEWIWYLKIRPYLVRGFAILCGIFSTLIVWSEVTLFATDADNQPAVSVFRFLLSKDLPYSTVETLAIVTIVYMCLCAYSSLMKMKIFSKYSLLDNHNTDPASLLFFGAFMCRIAYPLCYNFLNLAGNSDHTVFETIMGRINIFRLFGDKFNLYVPILISLTCFSAAFNVVGYVLTTFGVENYFDERKLKDDRAVEEGRKLIEQARQTEERRIARGERPGGDDADTYNILTNDNAKQNTTPSSKDNKGYKPTDSRPQKTTSIADSKNAKAPNNTGTGITGLLKNVKLPGVTGSNGKIGGGGGSANAWQKLDDDVSSMVDETEMVESPRHDNIVQMLSLNTAGKRESVANTASSQPAKAEPPKRPAARNMFDDL